LAIYQYKVYLIPRKSIVEKYNKILKQLFIDHEGWEKHWDKESNEDIYDFEDALTVKWWTERRILFEPIEPLIVKFAKQVAWTKNSVSSKSYGNSETNDIFIDITKENFIEHFTFRFDLRKFDQKFMDNIFNIAKQIDCLLLDRKGNLFEPTIEAFTENAKKSSAFLFVENPSEYMYQLSTGLFKHE
jgi:hypothetical protein